MDDNTKVKKTGLHFYLENKYSRSPRRFVYNRHALGLKRPRDPTHIPRFDIGHKARILKIKIGHIIRTGRSGGHYVVN